MSTNDAPIRVLVVDDDPFVCQSLDTILSAQPDVTVVATGTNGDDAVALYERHLPNVLLMDIQMQGTDGISAAERILASHPDARIVFLTTFSDDDYIVRALRIGARGYLIKQDVRTIAPALRSVMAGQRVLEGEVLERATSFGRGDIAGAGHDVADDTPTCDESALAGLSERERDVVRAIAEGLDNGEIADGLCMSEGTVRNHTSSILAKLGLRNRTQIAVWYYKRCR